MILVLLSMFLCGVPLFADIPANCHEQVQSLNEEIKQLEGYRVKILGKADMLEDDALRWQTIPEQFNEMRHAYAQATEYRMQAAMIRERVDILKIQKQEMLKSKLVSR